MDLIHVVQAIDQWWANEILNSKEDMDFFFNRRVSHLLLNRKGMWN